MPDGSIASTPFSVTPAALAQVAEIAAAQGKPGAGLRLAVEAGGCSGFQYKFDLTDAPEEEDLVIENRVFIDPVSLDLLRGAQLDWADELIGAHFKVTNPVAVSGCGCGVSFSVG